jgi:hypothetical protein
METLLVGLVLGLALAYLMMRRQKDPSHNAPKTLDNFEGESDAWEGSFWEASEPTPVNAVVLIDYTDANGLGTQRTVTVRQFDRDYLGGMFIGHCHLRNATRTFRVDRVKSCVDSETGEIVSDVRAYLTQRYENSPESSARKLLETDYDTLRVLLYVGRADGQLRQAERQLYLDVCQAIATDSRLTLDMIDRLVENIDDLSVNAFKQAVTRLSKQSSETQSLVLRAAEQMIATQKTIHAVEQEAIDYMRGGLSK